MNQDLLQIEALPRPAETLASPSEREAFSLGGTGGHGHHDDVPRFPTAPHGVQATNPVKQQNRLQTFWRRHIAMVVSHNACRDHLANERTFMGYLRSGQAFAMMGVVTAQLMKLSHSENPDPVLGFLVISVPMATACYAAALIITLLGLVRFLNWQKAMAAGKATSGGWELLATFFLSAAVLTSFLVLTVAILVRNG